MSYSPVVIPPASYLEDIGFALGRLATGVHVITATEPGVNGKNNKVGMLASWVTQAGFEPPSVAVAVAPGRELFSAIMASERFSINVLAKSANQLMKAFSYYKPDQFDQVAYQETSLGIVLNDAVSVLHCRLVEVAGEALDHRILLGIVEGGQVLNPNAEPFVHLRKTGFSY